jgi:Icc-related predicted phosphoesterase
MFDQSDYEWIAPPQAKELKVLLVSDSHANGLQLNQLAAWLSQRTIDYDLVLLAGNLSNITNPTRAHPSAEYQGAVQVTDTLAFFRDHVGKPIIYVPGNTEPSAVYDYGLGVPYAINAHKRAVQLDESLLLVGLGGAIPVSKDGKTVLEGYPYKSDEEFGKELATCMDSVIQRFGSGVDVLLLTHMGPTDSATSDVYLASEKINAGSLALSHTLKTYSSQILCNIHGHSSLAEGFTKPYSPTLQVINPGGLTTGRFGELHLVKQPTGHWQVVSVNFYNLGC